MMVASINKNSTPMKPSLQITTVKVGAAFAELLADEYGDGAYKRASNRELAVLAGLCSYVEDCIQKELAERDAAAAKLKEETEAGDTP